MTCIAYTLCCIYCTFCLGKAAGVIACHSAIRPSPNTLLKENLIHFLKVRLWVGGEDEMQSCKPTNLDPKWRRMEHKGSQHCKFNRSSTPQPMYPTLLFIPHSVFPSITGGVQRTTQPSLHTYITTVMNKYIRSRTGKQQMCNIHICTTDDKV